MWRERFLSRIYVTDSCWLWKGQPTSKGYGVMRVGGRQVEAHRLSYRLFYGDFDEKLHIHHVCENRLCVNPDHLLVVTPKEHRRIHAPTVCVNGHPYSEENTYWRPNGQRDCCICRRDRSARYRQRKELAPA